VIDFGLAKLAGNGDSSLAEQRFLGTPAFASPEQTQGRTIDGRSDIYSLGVTLWYSLTGELPRRGETFSLAPLLERRIPQLSSDC
jgi:serine/threonine-protein kinase